MSEPLRSSQPGMGALLYPDGVAFRLWAPHAERVFVVGDFNNWKEDATPLAAEQGGYWYTEVPGATAGQLYRYVIHNGSRKLFRVDPYARQVTSSAGNSVVHDARFDWPANGFQAPGRNQTVIYEMHVGTFSYQSSDKPGTLRGAMGKLPYLKDLGINAIELMPTAEFMGSFSWGYNPALIFAIESDYGGPQALKEFVKAAHSQGMAVILDVVYNHFGPGDLDLWQFDGWSENGKGGIYFYNDGRCQTPWGETRPDYGRPEVRQYIRDNALMWLADFQVDGLRWDATAFIRNTHGSNDSTHDIAEGWSLMQWINTEIAAHHGDKLSIAEDMQDNPALTKPAQEGGAGFDSQWDARFVRSVRAALTCPEDQSVDLDAVRDAILHRCGSDAFNRVIYTESHDEVANGRARVPEEIAPGDAQNWYAKKLSTLGAVLAFTAPGIPMIFQGQEFLEDDWFHDKDPVDWAKKATFAGILQFYKDLIRLRLNHDKTTAGLCEPNVNVHHVNADQKIIAFHRYGKGGPGDDVVIAVNLKNKPADNYQIGLPRAGLWQVRLNSDGAAYDGSFAGHRTEQVIAQPGDKDGMPLGGTLDIGPYTAVVLSQDR